MAELEVTSASRFALGSGGFTGGGELRAANGEGQRGGVARGLIGGLCIEKRKESRHSVITALAL